MELVTVKWLNKSQTTLLFTFKDSFTAQDYLEAVKYSRDMVHYAKPNKFHVVADISEIQSIPHRLITTMRREYRIPEDGYSNITILVGASTVVRYTVHLFKGLFIPNHFYFADSINHAILLLHELE